MPPYVLLAATLLASAAVGVAWTRRDGRTRSVPEDDATRLSAADLALLGVETTGERATLVQFTSAFCAPCRATRRILGEVAEMVDGVTYAEVDAETHLDAVRRFNVLRTPTVLVLDADRRVVVRASGQPRKADVIAAVGKAASTAGARIT
jgi:thiol-disulfide isomerase/thioredoxin